MTIFKHTKRVKRTLVGLGLSLSLVANAFAHDIYIWPSFFTLNSDKAVQVPVFVTASHTTYRPDFGMPSDSVELYGVDGKKVRRSGGYYQGARLSTFDFEVDGEGTYGLFYNRKPSYFTRYTIGKRDSKKAKRGVKKSQIAEMLPKDAKNIKTARYTTMGISYITNKAPTNEVLKPKNKGFEMVPVTHPADYVTNEAAKVKFLYDGKPVADVNVIIEREGVQYLADPKALELKSDKNGEVQFTFKDGGRYMLKVAHEQDSIDPEADVMVSRVYYAFEVIYE